MAKVFRAPIEPPAFNYATWREDGDRYIKELRALARKNARGSNLLVGEVIRFQVADGYAQYMVWSVSPLNLVHIDLMDGYRIPDAHARGLRLADVKAMVERDKAIAALFAEKEKA